MFVNFPPVDTKQSNDPIIVPIRKIDVSIDSLIAAGIIWEWNAAHNDWMAFREDANALIEQAFGDKKKRKNSTSPVNLSIIGLPYTVDVKNYRQRNTYSGRQRKIRRKSYSSYLDVLPTFDVQVEVIQDSSVGQQQTSGEFLS